MLSKLIVLDVRIENDVLRKKTLF